MAEIAKGYKTITRVDDGYSIVATPSTILIPTNYDGTNPVLTGAKARVLVTNALGTSLTVTITSITPTGCTATYSGNELTITGISSDNANVLVYFSATGGYTGNINIPVLKAKQGESAYSVVLTNETHALPADYNGTVSPSAIDMAQSQIIVLKGATPLTPVAANATPGIGQFRYNIGTVTGGTAVRVNNSTFKLATITASTCKIKVTIYLESLSRSVEKEMVITKVAEGSPGPQAPLVLDRGEFDPTATYVGTSQRVDVVLYGGTPYITKPTAGTFSGIPPTNTSKWDTFGATYESMFTKVLSATTATINTLGVRRVSVNDNNVPRTTIGIQSTESGVNDPTKSNAFDINGFRQYHASGRISAYMGLVNGFTYTVGGVPKTLNGWGIVVFNDDANSSVFSVFDSITTGAGWQYVSGTSYHPINLILIDSDISETSLDSEVIEDIIVSNSVTKQIFALKDEAYYDHVGVRLGKTHTYYRAVTGATEELVDGTTVSANKVTGWFITDIVADTSAPSGQRTPVTVTAKRYDNGVETDASIFTTYMCMRTYTDNGHNSSTNGSFEMASSATGGGTVYFQQSINWSASPNEGFDVLVRIYVY